MATQPDSAPLRPSRWRRPAAWLALAAQPFVPGLGPALLGLRAAVAIVLPAVTFFAIAPAVSATWEYDLKQVATFAAVTVAVTTLPQLGTVAPRYVERSGATLVGGFLAFGFLNASTNTVWRVFATIVPAGCGLMWGEAYSHPYAGRLFSVSAVSVMFGVNDSVAQAANRIVGVLAGVACSAVVSALLLPATASRKVLGHLEASLAALHAASEGMWGQYIAAMEAAAAQRATLGAGEDSGADSEPAAGTDGGSKATDGGSPLPPPAAEALAVDIAEPAARHASTGRQLEQEQQPGGLLQSQPSGKSRASSGHGEGSEGGDDDDGSALESLLDDAAAHMRKVRDCLKEMPLEAYVWSCWRGRVYIFLPNLPWWPGWRPYVPPTRVKAVLDAMRRCARLLWTLHLTVQPGFAPRLAAGLGLVHDPRLLCTLPALVADAFAAVLAAYQEERRAAHRPRAEARGSAAQRQLVAAESGEGGGRSKGSGVPSEAGSDAAAPADAFARLAAAAAQLLRESRANRSAAIAALEAVAEAAGTPPHGPPLAPGAPAAVALAAGGGIGQWVHLGDTEEAFHARMRLHTLEHLLDHLSRRLCELADAVAALGDALPH